jgi:hypothetical protein
MVVMAVAGASLWPQIEREYFLHQLRSDPSRLEEMLTAEYRGVQAAALKFTQEKAGRTCLFDLYLKEYGKLMSSWPRRSGEYRGFLVLWEDGFSCQSWTGASSQTSIAYTTAPDNRLTRQRVLERLSSCVGESFKVEAFEGFEFQVASVADGTAELPAWPAMRDSKSPAFLPQTPVIKSPAQYVCFFRKR